MTGEITLRGQVLPIGGLKEKLLGGASRGIKNGLNSVPKINVTRGDPGQRDCRDPGYSPPG